MKLEIKILKNKKAKEPNNAIPAVLDSLKYTNNNEKENKNKYITLLYLKNLIVDNKPNKADTQPKTCGWLVKPCKPEPFKVYPIDGIKCRKKEIKHTINKEKYNPTRIDSLAWASLKLKYNKKQLIKTNQINIFKIEKKIWKLNKKLWSTIKTKTNSSNKKFLFWKKILLQYFKLLIIKIIIIIYFKTPYWYAEDILSFDKTKKHKLKKTIGANL